MHSAPGCTVLAALDQADADGIDSDIELGKFFRPGFSQGDPCSP